MPKVVDEKERRNEIADAAVRVFAENGFRKTSVQEIADEADMSKGNLYFYFNSKKEILSRIFARFEEVLHETIGRSLESSDNPVEQLENISIDLFELFEENEPLIKVIFDFWSYSLHTSGQNIIDFDSFYNRIQEKLDTVLDRGREQGIFRDDIKEKFSSVLVGYLEGRLVQWQINPSSPPLGSFEESGFAVILDGLMNGDGE